MPRRIAVIDIGSNTVRFVVYDGASRSPLAFFNEKVTCRLGQNLQETGFLNPEGVERAIRGLRRFRALAEAMGVSRTVAIATAAVRSAADGIEFCRRAEQESGFSIDVISGPEEARLSAMGVLSGRPDAKGLVCDMGGSSMELAWVEEGETLDCISTPFAPLSVGKGDGKEVSKSLGKLRKNYPKKIKNLYLVGGSFRAIARLDIERLSYPLSIIHDYNLSRDGVREIARLLEEEETAIVASDLKISADRYELLPRACSVLLTLLDSFEPKRILMSSFGLREGALFSALPKKMRAEDPLISAAGAMANRSARFPEFGPALYDWVRPMFDDVSKRIDRLIHAACLLHDVNWRAHPDYRAEVSFDTAARANLAGLSHIDRVFLGIALMHRYAMRLSNPSYQAMSSLLAEEENTLARALGMAMRLGALFSSAGAEGLDDVTIARDGDALVLKLGSKAGAFDGEKVERRLSDVAVILGLKADLRA
ncbi:MAG: Ppx/GppA phosphatase family protein [Pseudomonadota bacterium]